MGGHIIRFLIHHPWGNIWIAGFRRPKNQQAMLDCDCQHMLPAYTSTIHHGDTQMADRTFETLGIFLARSVPPALGFDWCFLCFTTIPSCTYPLLLDFYGFISITTSAGPSQHGPPGISPTAIL